MQLITYDTSIVSRLASKLKNLLSYERRLKCYVCLNAKLKILTIFMISRTSNILRGFSASDLFISLFYLYKRKEIADFKFTSR